MRKSTYTWTSVTQVYVLQSEVGTMDCQDSCMVWRPAHQSVIWILVAADMLHTDAPIRFCYAGIHICEEYKSELDIVDPTENIHLDLDLRRFPK